LAKPTSSIKRPIFIGGEMTSRSSRTSTRDMEDSPRSEHSKSAIAVKKVVHRRDAVVVSVCFLLATISAILTNYTDKTVCGL